MWDGGSVNQIIWLGSSQASTKQPCPEDDNHPVSLPISHAQLASVFRETWKVSLNLNNRSPRGKEDWPSLSNIILPRCRTFSFPLYYFLSPTRNPFSCPYSIPPYLQSFNFTWFSTYHPILLFLFLGKFNDSTSYNVWHFSILLSTTVNTPCKLPFLRKWVLDSHIIYLPIFPNTSWTNLAFHLNVQQLRTAEFLQVLRMLMARQQRNLTWWSHCQKSTHYLSPGSCWKPKLQEHHSWLVTVFACAHQAEAP